MTMVVTGLPPAVSANSLAPVELDDSCTVTPVAAGVPPAVTSSTVIGPRSGLAVAAPVTAGEVMTRAVPAVVTPGFGPVPAPGPVAGAPLARAWFWPPFRATLSAAVRAAALAGSLAAAADSTVKVWPLAGGPSAGLTELRAVSR